MENMFNGDFGGPMISGTWYNQRTGDSFTVRDSYFEGDEFYVLAYDGRRFNASMLSQYVKSDVPIKKEQSQQPQNSVPQNILDLVDPNPSDISSDILPEDLALLNQPIANPAFQPMTQQVGTKAVVDDEDMLLVKRTLKRAPEPVISCSIKWDNFPTKAMEMLTDYMYVDVEKICEYYINKIDTEQIKAATTKALKSYIKKQCEVQEQVVEQEPVKPVIVEKKEKPAVKKVEPTKKSKKK